MRRAFALGITMLAAAGVLATSSMTAATAGPPKSVGSSESATRNAATGEAMAGRTAFTLPHHTIKNADGSIDTIADTGSVAALQSVALATGGCGYTCDGKDPNSYVWNGSTCNDAVTIYRHDEGWAYAELRFSGRCATAWTRTCCYARAGGFGYASNGTQRSSVFNYSGVYSGSPIWTAMLYDYGTLRYKACFDRVVAGDGNEWACTDRL